MIQKLGLSALAIAMLATTALTSPATGASCGRERGCGQAHSAQRRGGVSQALQMVSVQWIRINKYCFML